MAAAAGSARQVDVSRIAPSGDPVALTLPTALGEYRWYGNSRFTGPRVARQFFLAPAREHHAIPANILRGGREDRAAMRGFDAVLFEAPDRSDSALVLAGPYHEATTWFGGPAPDSAAVSRMLSTFTFTDSPVGAALVPTSDLLVHQSDVALIGRNDSSVLVARRAVDVLPSLPEWEGMRVEGGELWRAGRVLDEGQTERVAGTPHQWRYLFASESVAMDLVMLGPESGRAATTMDDSQVVEALSVLAGSWAAPADARTA